MLEKQRDTLFIAAGKIVIEKGRGSIGLIQRNFKINFNRAARIMEQLCETGVVGPEDGVKSRKILMTMDMFERYIKDAEHAKCQLTQIESETETILKSMDRVLAELEAGKMIPIDTGCFLKDRLGIEVDYSNDGKILKNIKNFIIPSIANEFQLEFINTLLKYNSPETLKLILIDDSIITYSEYNGIPQLYIPVVTDIKKFDGVIDWCSAEMEGRIQKFVEYRVKNIDSYNEKIKTSKKDAFPRIIIIVNEANDFFQNVSVPLERMLMNCNIVGMHFILFSRFSLRSLSLGIVEELLEVYTADKLKMLLSQPINMSTGQRITRNFDDMDGQHFECFCADVLRQNGFKNVKVTQGSGDHGIDILAEKDDITYAIQCKCYSSQIGNSAIQQAHSGKGFYHKDIAVVLTNRYFTAQAKEEARALGVKLWDRDKLNEMIDKTRKGNTL